MTKQKKCRPVLTKKMRFEVFKRDKFTCQYCGRQAPEIVLEIDHIKPISKGGANDILNLITSCFDCNRGKTNRELSDASVIMKHRKQMEILQDRKGHKILSDYISALKNYGYSDDDILHDLINEVIPTTKKSHNWSDWRAIFENWTDDINGWTKKGSPPNSEAS